MNHPRYDNSDPKAGQPVLIGDAFWYRYLADGEIKGPLRADSFNAKYIVEVSGVCPHSISTDGYQFFSAPPAPKIEACKCGRGCDSTPSSVRVDGDSAPNHPYGQWWVVCAQCHRRGPMVTGRGPAIAAWNADQRKLKV
jgi:hypothetical protein